MSNLPIVDAEISIEPIGTSDTSMGKEVSTVYNAICGISSLRKVTLTAMSTQIESNSLDDILQAVRLAHDSAKSAGVKRIISTVRIDERLDKPNTLDEKIQSVKNKG
ncbi:MAG: MTH1187 family thiamine-binding protein [Thermoproteota archaeon]